MTPPSNDPSGHSAPTGGTTASGPEEPPANRGRHLHPDAYPSSPPGLLAALHGTVQLISRGYFYFVVAVPTALALTFALDAAVADEVLINRVVVLCLTSPLFAAAAVKASGQWRGRPLFSLALDYMVPYLIRLMAAWALILGVSFLALVVWSKRGAEAIAQAGPTVVVTVGACLLSLTWPNAVLIYVVGTSAEGARRAWVGPRLSDAARLAFRTTSTAVGLTLPLVVGTVAIAHGLRAAYAELATWLADTVLFVAALPVWVGATVAFSRAALGDGAPAAAPPLDGSTRWKHAAMVALLFAGLAVAVLSSVVS